MTIDEIMHVLYGLDLSEIAEVIETMIQLIELETGQRCSFDIDGNVHLMPED